jgi:hypothetical protein
MTIRPWREWAAASVAPVDRTDEPDRHPWRAAVLLGVVTIALGMLSSLVIVPAIHGYHGWMAPDDAWISILSARDISSGAFGFIYSSTGLFVAGPLLPMVLAPVSGVGDAFRLTYNYPYQIEHPSMWLLYGPYAFALCIPFFFAVRRLAFQLGLGARAAVLQWWTLVLVVVPLAVISGHFEDVLALTFVLLSVRGLLRGERVSAALLFGVAIAFQPWAVLGLPVFLAVVPAGYRARNLVRVLTIPGLLVAVPLLVDRHAAAAALFRPAADPISLSHAALWVANRTVPVVATPARAGAFLLAVAVARWMWNRTPDPRLLLAALGVVFLARIFFEPYAAVYQLAPGLAFLLLHERLTTGRWVRTGAIGVVLTAFFFLHLAPPLWWPGAVVLTIPLVWPAVRDVVRRPAAVVAEAEPLPAAA